MHPSEIPLNVLAEAAADGVILIDDQSTILFVNPAAGRIFGYEPVDILGNKLTSLMPERLRQIHLTSLERYIATGQIPKVESAILSNVRYYGRNIVEFHTSTSAHELIRREPNEVGGQNKLSIEQSGPTESR